MCEGGWTWQQSKKEEKKAQKGPLTGIYELGMPKDVFERRRKREGKGRFWAAAFTVKERRKRTCESVAKCIYFAENHAKV